MVILIITALIVIGLLLFIVEVFLIPCTSIAGFAAAACLIIANFYAFSTLGQLGGLITLAVTVFSVLAVVVWFMRSKSLERLALNKNIDSTVGTAARQEVKVGDTGKAITRLALIGNAEINGNIVEVKSADGFINENTPIRVSRLLEGVIFVEKKEIIH